MSDRVRRAVAIGGGTGLPKVLRCLLELGYETAAVVTMADDGGSSGLLRRELGMLPPGDARNCLVAMAADPDSPVAKVFSYRFPHGEGLAGHALGNLIIAALADIEGSFPDALATAHALLSARGRVYPSTLDDVVLAAEDITGARVIGQAKVADSAAPIATVHYANDMRAHAFPPAAAAIRAADLVVVGPGSLFTSLLPNFLVDGITDAMREARGRVVYMCNVANQRGETTGMDAADHVDALLRHGLWGVFDVVVVHGTAEHPLPSTVEPVVADERAIARIREQDIEVLVADVADPNDPRHHGVEGLTRVLAEVGRR
jgi:uncharacterized cofD-like protein